MHIPDGGFLDARTCVAAAALAATGVGAALWQTRRVPPRKVPLMGLSAAFVFAAQMLNFPIPGGTSGHLIGGVLTAVLLGPAPAILVLTAVMIVQCFLFGDGGVLPLGANILNMAIVDSVGGYLVYRLLKRVMPGMRGQIAAVAFAAWFGAVLASVVCTGELVTSHTVRAAVGFPTMVGVHMVIGVGEAIITAMVIVAVYTSRPQLLEQDAEPTGRRATQVGFVAYGFLIAVALAVFVSPFASQSPDGLDRASEKLGFAQSARTHYSPIADYKTPFIASPAIATALGGLLGTIVVFLLSLVLARVLVPSRGSESGSDPIAALELGAPSS